MSQVEDDGFGRREVIGAGAAIALLYATPHLATPMGRSPTDYAPFVDAVSDTLIPGAGRQQPGAYLAGLPAYNFRTLTLAHVETVRSALSRIANGDFVAISPERRAQALTLIERTAFDQRAASSDLAEAWHAMKLALLSLYYTSEQGAARDLAYEIVPGRWEPDIPLSKQPHPLSNDYLATSYT